MMNNLIVKRLLKHGESETLDFKRGDADLTSITRTVCAFANSKGGTVIVGVTNRGDVDGVKNAEEQNMALRKAVRQAISPRLYIASAVVEISKGKQVIVVDVPSSEEIPYTCGNKIFVRQATQTVEASGAIIRELITERHSRYARWERQLAHGETFESLDDKEIMMTARTGNESNLADFGINFTPHSVLEELGLVEGDALCNGAIVLFGKRPARRFPQTRIRAVRYSGTGRDRLADNRVFEGNAFTQLGKAISFLEAHIPVQSAIPTDELRRKEKPAIPFPAVREALLNALVHRDYAAPDGGVIVSVYADRLEIWNAGSLPDGISPSSLKTITVSRPHNPDMAHVFLLRGYIERVGSGIQRILTAFKQAKLPEPEWKEMGGGITVVLRWQKVSLEINERQRRLLKTLRPGEATNVTTYRNEFGKEIKDRQARKDLKELVDLGYLRIRGKGRSTEYVRAERELR
ncbi:MAG: putative DNA binding domain-containing protein [Thermodesulfobacteriota bacterium]|nr:putative DNA binding domain-containing protein [Thermodesulfobacteriota bacterium]